jgi:acetyl esterase/lipase
MGATKAAIVGSTPMPIPRLSLVALLLSGLSAFGQEATTSQNNDRLREGLARFPAADADQDGILTLQEATSFLAKMRKSAADKPAADALKPDLTNVAYGPHERNVLDFYRAKSDTPTPVVVFIHGGGFVNGSKDKYAESSLLRGLVANGVSCVAINYRFLDSAPLQDILHDCARAVQFVRSKAGEWNLDKTRVAATGGSAGAGSSLWLATRDDLADSNATDPVQRESSRVCCAALTGTQATYDVTRWESFLGPAKPEFRGTLEAAEYYHLESAADLSSPAGRAALHECDMLAWISKDDVPLFIDNPQDVPAPTNRGEWLHCTQHARAVKKQCVSVGLECTVVQDEKGTRPDVRKFLQTHLGTASAE